MPTRAGRRLAASSGTYADGTSASTSSCAWKNASIGGGPAPVRAHIEELLPNVLEGQIEPERVFDCTGPLDEDRSATGR